MRYEIIISGFGGQGVFFTGTLLALVAINEGKFVTSFPSYGAEMRGGTANCQIIISDNPIGSPKILNADGLILFNKQSYDKFSEKFNYNKDIVINSNLCSLNYRHSIYGIIEVPANHISEKCGSILSMNMVMLGVFLKKIGLFDIESVSVILKEMLRNKKKDSFDCNKKALLAGYSLKDKFLQIK